MEAPRFPFPAGTPRKEEWNRFEARHSKVLLFLIGEDVDPDGQATDRMHLIPVPHGAGTEFPITAASGDAVAVLCRHGQI